MLLALLVAPAVADVVPDGGRYVDYAIAVENLEAFPDQVLFVYPHSESNGVPMAEVARVQLGRTLSFGRRIEGQPALYGVSESEWKGWRAAYPDGTLGEDPAAIAALLGVSTACGVEITPRTFAPDGSSTASNVDTFVVEELAPGACRVRAPAPAEAPPEPTTSSSWCATVPGLPASGLGIAALLLARRRRAGGRP